MSKIRVYELAKMLGKSNKEMMDLLKDLGVDVKNHMSSIES
jgi:translation initiation factor IF-2